MVLLANPSIDLYNDVDTCTTGKIVNVDGSTESCITRTRQRLKSDMPQRPLGLVIPYQREHTLRILSCPRNSNC